MDFKKIIVVIGSLNVGGAETFLSRYLPYLSKQNWEIELFTLSYEPGILAEKLQKNGVTVTPILNNKDAQKLAKYPKLLERAIRIFLTISRLSARLKQENNAILHLFLPEAYVLGMLAALLANFPGPKVMSRRSLNDYQKRRPVVSFFERKLHQFTSIVIANSERVINQLYEEGIPKEKVRLIYNGLQIEDNISTPSKDLQRNLLKIEKETMVFMIIANLIPYKGHADLLKAFHLIKDKIKRPWKLICVGRDQGIGEQLKNLCSKYQLQDNVIWLGERKDVTELLHSADVGILCSHEEGFSNAILECMAAGLPMVVTDVGGNGEAVLDGITGVVVPAKNPEALGQGILSLISDEIRMKELGEMARRRVKDNFTLEECAAKHIEIYHLLGKSRNKSSIANAG